MTRPLPLLAVCCAVIFLATACTDDDPGPNFSSLPTTPTTSATTSPTESPSPTDIPSTGPNVGPGEVPPTAAAEADEHDQAGALAFAAYYYRLSDWAFATSNFAMLDVFFAPGCGPCTSAQLNLKGLVSDGHYFTGGRITTNSVSIVPTDGRSASEVAVSGTFSVAAADLRDAAGTVIESQDADPEFKLTDWLAWSGDHWQIVDEEKS